MDRDPPRVTVTLYDCEQCDTSMTPTYHGDGCDAPVIYTDSERVCSNCGVTIAPAETERCLDCDGRAPPSRFAAPIDISPAVSPRQVERAIHDATNRHRTSRSRPRLDYSEHLSAIALRHSRDMATREYFDHHSPEGNSPGDRYRNHDHSDRSYGENIAFEQPGPAISSTELAERIVDGWMDSPGHRESILEDQFDAEGIGVYTLPDGTVLVTQNFK